MAYANYPNPAPKKKSNALRVLALALVGAVLLCGISVVIVGVAGQKKPAAVQTGQPVDATSAPAVPATTAAAKAPAVPTIADGTWTVGEDIPAGNYKAVGAGSNCYWSITKSGSNGSDIVDNHIGGGNLRVTLKAGQDFETKRCGTWQKV